MLFIARSGSISPRSSSSILAAAIAGTRSMHAAAAFGQTMWIVKPVMSRLLLALPMALVSSATKAKSLVGQSRSEEHTSELQSLMRNSYAVFSLTKKKNKKQHKNRKQY